MKTFDKVPTTFQGQTIKVNGRTMIWQDNAIHKGYVYHG